MFWREKVGEKCQTRRENVTNLDENVWRHIAVIGDDTQSSKLPRDAAEVKYGTKSNLRKLSPPKSAEISTASGTLRAVQSSPEMQTAISKGTILWWQKV